MLKIAREMTLKEKMQNAKYYSIQLHLLLKEGKGKKALLKILKNPTLEQEKKLRKLGWRKIEERIIMTHLTSKEFREDIRKEKLKRKKGG